MSVWEDAEALQSSDHVDLVGFRPLLISCDLSVIKTLVISQNSDLEGGSRLVKAVAVWF